MKFTKSNKTTIILHNLTVQLNTTPLSASSFQSTAQLDGVALKIIDRSALTPVPQGPLALLTGSYPLNHFLNQQLLFALGPGGCIDASILIIFFYNVVQLL